MQRVRVRLSGQLTRGQTFEESTVVVVLETGALLLPEPSGYCLGPATAEGRRVRRPMG